MTSRGARRRRPPPLSGGGGVFRNHRVHNYAPIKKFPAKNFEIYNVMPSFDFQGQCQLQGVDPDNQGRHTVDFEIFGGNFWSIIVHPRLLTPLLGLAMECQYQMPLLFHCQTQHSIWTYAILHRIMVWQWNDMGIRCWHSIVRPNTSVSEAFKG